MLCTILQDPEAGFQREVGPSMHLYDMESNTFSVHTLLMGIDNS